MARTPGSPSDDLPDVLATGVTDASVVFVSLSARAEDGRDADYIEWHSLDHRPEQHRLEGLRHSQRLVSTPACRAVRAAADDRFDAVDHVMTYHFAHAAALGPFAALGGALRRSGRMPMRLPSVELGVFDTVGRLAARRVGVGSDVIPWRPAAGTYLLIEDGSASPGALVDVDGVAGAWWHEGAVGPSPFDTDHRGLQLTHLFLDDEPVAVAERLLEPLADRWRSAGVSPLLAAPFHEVVPHDWSRHLPSPPSER